MPENIDGIAFTTAKDIAAKNGFTDGKNGVTVDVVPGQHPNQLKVTITENGATTRSRSAIGIGIDNVTRHARRRVPAAGEHGEPDQPVRERSDARRHRARQHALPRLLDQRVRPGVAEVEGRRDPVDDLWRRRQLRGLQHRLRPERLLLRRSTCSRRRRRSRCRRSTPSSRTSATTAATTTTAATSPAPRRCRRTSTRSSRSRIRPSGTAPRRTARTAPVTSTSPRATTSCRGRSTSCARPTSVPATRPTTR